jgi:putative alpha-1,2-mannosidase
MKKILLFVFALTTTITSAQDLIKVKGNREVTTEISPIAPFKMLEISNDYEIEIVPGASPQVEITTDSNLHQHLAASVIDGKLVVTTTARIRSKKEMKFRIIYGPELKTITVTDDAVLSSVTSLIFEELELNIEKDAEVFITASVERLTLNAERSTKSELNLSGKNAVINLKNNADVKALIKYDNLELHMKDRVDAKIEGDIKNGQMTMTDTASLEGKNLVFDDLELKINNNAKTEINVKNNFSLNSSDDAEVTLYNTPKIEVKKFIGKSVLKKE